MLKQARTTVFSALVAGFFAVPAAAQEPHNPDSLLADSAQTLKPVRIDAERSRYSTGASRTATKTPALTRNVPQSIVTVSKQLMHDQGMQGLGDVVRYIPGMMMGQGEGNRDQITIRGNNTTADFFVDGVRDDVQYFRDLYNLERVEALKGSNAMVFGRGGGGGVLNRVTKEAGWNTRHEVIAEGSTFGGRRISTDLQQNVSPWVAARLNSVYENSELYRDGASIQRSGFNPTISIATPSRRTRAAFGYEYFDDKRTADRGIPSLQGKPLNTDPSTFFGNPFESDATAKVNSANATISHEAGAFHLRNHTRAADYDKYYRNIFPGAVTANGQSVSISGYSNSTGRRNFFNQTDINWNGRTGSVGHSILVGAEIGRQATDNFRNTAFFGDAVSVVVPVANPRAPAPSSFRQSASDADNKTVVNTKSVYLQDQITLSRYLQLIAGARYEKFDVHYDDLRSDAERERSDDMISPRVGIVVKPAELVSLYASYSLSFLPGSGDQFSSLTEVTAGLEPERFANYEAGVKWDVLDRLALSASAYRLDRTNTRSIDPANPTKLIQTGEQRSSGFELSANGDVTPRWEMSAGFARQKAEITSATASSAAGARVPFVPRTSLALWNRYNFTSRIGAAVGAVHQSKSFAAIDNTVTLPSFERIDGALFARLAWGLRAQVNVENILNEKYFPTAHSNNNITPGSPRAARLTISADF